MHEAEIFSPGGLKFLLVLPILPKRPSPRQITASRTFSNVLSENETVDGDQLSVAEAVRKSFLPLTRDLP
jgi:hypothetical protein